MKVVLFCGGLGTRLREQGGTFPKPLVNVGDQPILWHLMKYYAHFGHTEFILCLGFGGEHIRAHFAALASARQGDSFTVPDAGAADWMVDCVDTGLEASIGERLLAVRERLAGRGEFLANYSDGLSDLALPGLLAAFRRAGSVACLASVRPRQSFHAVQSDEDGRVTSLASAGTAGVRINGGFFVFGQALFDYLRAGEDLVDAPFRRLIDAGQLLAYRHDGFWACMDTFKDKQELDAMEARGDTPWKVWLGR